MSKQPVPNKNGHNFEAAMAAGAAACQPYERKHGQTPLFVVPEGYNLTEAPAREFIVQTINTDSVDAFVDYVKRHGTARSLVLEQLPASAFCLLDYHQEQAPRPNRHRVVLGRRRDVSFNAWCDFVGRGSVDQKTFVEFIEEHTEDVVKPSGGELLDLIRKVEAKTEVNFTSVISDDGLQKVVYAETAEARSGEKGSLEIPRVIELYLPLFFNGEVYSLSIRVRLSVVNGKLLFRLAWLDKDKALDRDAAAVNKALRVKLAGVCDVLRGTDGGE